MAWKFWVPLVNGRPPQDLSYVFGIDVSNGAGGSNSVISVVADEVGMKVAEFASAHYSPEDLAEQAVFAAMWFGGARPAFMVWENNGPGGIFGRKVVKLGWNHFYFQRQEGVRSEGDAALGLALESGAQGNFAGAIPRSDLQGSDHQPVQRVAG
jgi:hypothetical protein